MFTPIFEPRADITHLTKVQKLQQAWVNFVKESPGDEVISTKFQVKEDRGE